MRSANPYELEYEKLRRDGGNVPEQVSRLRENALARFVALGFPTTRDEEWRFTSVAPIAAAPFALAQPDTAAADAAPYMLGDADACELVFVNGRYAPGLSRRGPLPQGATVESLASAWSGSGGTGDGLAHLGGVAQVEGRAFTALNTAFLADGACIRIAANTIVNEPIHVLFISTADAARRTMSHPRVLVVMGENSQATIVETYAGADAGYFTNAVTEAIVGDNAVLDHYKLQHESVLGYHVGTLYVRLGRDANATSHSISLGGSLVRNDSIAVLAGEGGTCTLNGLYLADAQRHVDNHTTIDHASPHCGSRELYNGILADKARGVFNGKIVVRPDAQKTDARQTNRALLLSEDAQINAKPQLEIFANDVKCTHGAAVGQLDDEAIFYMRARGLPEAEARRMLIRAFAGTVLQSMRLAAARHRVEAGLQAHLVRALRAA